MEQQVLTPEEEQKAKFDAFIDKQLNLPGFPIIITEIRPVGTDGQTVSLRLEQLSERSITTQNGLLSFTMEGHSAFGSSKTKRVAFHNFGVLKLQELGLGLGQPLVFKDPTGNPIVPKLVISETQTPKEYINSLGIKVTQPAKVAGKDGGRLLYQGKPIYRNTYLAIPGMIMTDTLIPHDSIEQVVIVAPTVPSTETTVGAGEDVSLFAMTN